jgi:hypothetical protein
MASGSGEALDTIIFLPHYDPNSPEEPDYLPVMLSAMNGLRWRLWCQAPGGVRPRHPPLKARTEAEELHARERGLTLSA